MKNVKKMLTILVATQSMTLLLIQGQAMASTILDFEVISAPDVYEPAYGRNLDYDFSMPDNTQFVTPAGLGILTQGYYYKPGPTNVTYDAVYNDIHIQNNMNATGGGLFAPNNGTTIAGSHDDAVLSKKDGSAFTLIQFEFAGYKDATTVYEKDLTVTGIFAAGGGSITETFTHDAVFGFQLFSLSPAWNNLSSVTFEHSGVGTYQGSFALDNIQVALTQVPLPAALFMFIPGLLGLGFVARRNRT